MNTTGTAGVLSPHHIFFMLDGGGSQHYRNKMLGCFVNEVGQPIEQKTEKLIYLMIDEESMRSRKGCVRGMNALDQVELLSVITKEPLDDMPRRSHKYFAGSNQGNKLGDLKVPLADELWKTSPEVRTKVHGPFLKPVGGATPGEPGPGRGKKPPAKLLEPVFWHTMDPRLYGELAHSFYCSRLLNLTAGDGTCELEMSKLKIPTVSICLTEQHKEQLAQHLEVKILKSMLDAADPLYEPELAARFKPIVAAAGQKLTADPKRGKDPASVPPTPAPVPRPAPGPRNTSGGTKSRTESLMKEFEDKIKAMTGSGEDQDEEEDSPE